MSLPLCPWNPLIAKGFVPLSLCLMVFAIPAQAIETEPHPLDTSLDHIFDFQEATGIPGTLICLEIDAQTIWLLIGQNDQMIVPCFLRAGNSFLRKRPALTIRPTQHNVKHYINSQRVRLLS